MVWSSLSPDGALSVKQNTAPMAANTVYTETTLNNDHFWNIGADEDGYHRKVSMESYADTAIGAPVDAPIPTGMDAVYYLKPANGRIAGFYRNASGIYQSVPGFIIGSVVMTTSFQTIVSMPEDCYGNIYFFRNDGLTGMAHGYFKVVLGVCQAYCSAQMIENNTTPSFPMKFGNGSTSSALNLRAALVNASAGTYQYRITFWAS